jgi:hypothetical protein
LPDNDESSISEITILPDGRIYVFGMSRQVLEVIESFQVDDPRVRRLSQHVKELTNCTSARQQPAPTVQAADRKGENNG